MYLSVICIASPTEMSRMSSTEMSDSSQVPRGVESAIIAYPKFTGTHKTIEADGKRCPQHNFFID